MFGQLLLVIDAAMPVWQCTFDLKTFGKEMLTIAFASLGAEKTFKELASGT